MTGTEAPPAPTNALGYTHRQIMLVMSGLMLGMLIASLDQTIVSTALTTISRQFHRVDLYGWVVTSYLLTSTATTPLYGKISDQFGRKRIFQAAIVIFLLGSALCGLSQNMYELILFRALQGIGAGGLVTVALSIVGEIIPPSDRGRYQGYFGAVFALSSIVGPLVGGFLVDQASWRWVFYVNLPIGAVALIVVNRVLRIDQVARSSRIDVAGAVLMVSGASLFLVAVQQAGTAAKITAVPLGFGIAGLVCIAGFLWWETRAPEPIIPLWLFRNRIFSVAGTLGFITGLVMFGALIFLPLYFQTVRKLSPTESGLWLFPMLIGMLTTSIVFGRLVSRLGRYKWAVVSGTATLATGLGFFSTISVGSSSWLISLMMLVVGAGMGMFMQLLVLSVQNALPPEHLGTGTGAVTFFRSLGGAIGAAVLGAIVLLQEKTHGAHYIRIYGKSEGALQSFTHALDHAFLYSMLVMTVAFILSFFLREQKLRGSSAERPSQPAEAPSPELKPAVG